MAYTCTQIHVHRGDDEPVAIEARMPFDISTRPGEASYGWGVCINRNKVLFYGFGIETIDAFIDALKQVRERAVEMEG